MSLTSEPLPSTIRQPWYRRWWGVVLLLVGGLLLAFGFAIALRTYTLVRQYQRGEITLAELSANQLQALKTNANAQATDLDIARAPSLGPATAPVTIVEFADFHCPYSYESAPILKSLLARYPGKIRLVLRHFPIIDQQSTDAALAAECAKAQSPAFFWLFHDQLFDYQDDLTESRFLTIAQSIGLDQTAFTQCYQSQQFQEEVLQDLATGVQNSVQGTPTFFVNGNKVTGHQPLDRWEAAINSLLQ